MRRDRFFPHGGVVRLCLAVSRATPHPDERSPVNKKQEEMEHKEMFKGLPDG